MRYKTLIASFLAFIILQQVKCLPNQIKIGILLHENQYEQEILFKWSIAQVNQRGVLGRTKLLGQIKRVDQDDCWDAERKACELLEGGSIALIGPSNPTTSQHVSSICDALDIPHLNVVPKGIVFNSQPLATNVVVGSKLPVLSPIEYQSTISVEMSISRNALLGAYLEVLSAMKWKNFVYLYEQDESLYYFQQHFNGRSLKTSDMDVRILRFDPMRPYRDVFWALKSTKLRHIVLDVECTHLHAILKHAQQVSMMTEEHGYLIVCPDTQAIDLEDFKHSHSRLVWLSTVDLASESMELLEQRSGDMNSRLVDSLAGFQLVPERLRTESALVHDAIEAMAYALQGVDASQTIESFSSVSCNKSKPWPYGSTLVNYLRTSVELDGMSGRVRFEPSAGQRWGHELKLMRLAEFGPKMIGNWSERAFEGDEGSQQQASLSINKQELLFLQQGDPALHENEERDTLIVSSIKSEPYFMNKQTTKIEKGNARYEGYAIDLIDELSRIVGFDYVFKEVDDGKYGNIDNKTREWNGMIREVMIGKADLAIADLSITSSREDAVDFTLPFMSTGISILFKKPTTKELELFSFLAPFEVHVWIYLGGAYLGVSIILFIVGRISPYEWADPHPCRQEDRILRNQFSASNAFWFTIAAVMQQGSDLAPRSLSTRLVASMWYFFTLIMISSYTANLAAFLTVEKVVYPIERAEDLYEHPQKIAYGCVESGSSREFFRGSKHPILSKMEPLMKHAASNDEGKARVENGNYAFFMESTSIEYIVERHCNLTQIGDLLDSKGYGIALAKNSTRKRDYRTKLSYAILSLQESGILEVLKNRWWKEKRGGGACDIDDEHSGDGVKELSLSNVGGVFVVLGMGITTSLLLCAMELWAKSCRLAQAHGTSKMQQLKRRLRLSLSLSENY